ncbi:MAG: hypothetical protein OEZ14_08980 [Acidimicrobiia bacterium]|nr:hypothetical protein [Acidimicrobiia bacterium]MDH5520654.1 hypothetical protein [Acidimicrobiia bacterium]
MGTDELDDWELVVDDSEVVVSLDAVVVDSVVVVDSSLVDVTSVDDVVDSSALLSLPQPPSSAASNAATAMKRTIFIAGLL